MKTKILFLAALFSIVVYPGLAFGMAKATKNTQVEGVVEFYGNAPFPRLGLKTDDGTLYYLDAEKELTDTLGSLHGSRIIVNGTISKEKAPIEMANAIVFRVIDFQEVKR